MREFDQQRIQERYNQLREEHYRTRKADPLKDAVREKEMVDLRCKAVRNGFIFSCPEYEDPSALWQYITRTKLHPSYLRPLTKEEAAYYASTPANSCHQSFSRYLKEHFNAIISRYPKDEQKEAARNLKAVIAFMRQSDTRRRQRAKKL